MRPVVRALKMWTIKCETVDYLHRMMVRSKYERLILNCAFRPSVPTQTQVKRVLDPAWIYCPGVLSRMGWLVSHLRRPFGVCGWTVPGISIPAQTWWGEKLQPWRLILMLCLHALPTDNVRSPALPARLFGFASF
eukprot:3756958-Pyramimonas_sp.AAC.2